MAPCTGGNRREGEAGGEASKLPQAASESGLLGLAAASTAITLAVCEPPPGLDKTTYLLSLSGVFFAGVSVTQVAASVRAAGGRPRAAGRKLVYVCLVAPVAVAAGLTVASLLQ